jgi:hypothetical protein
MPVRPLQQKAKQRTLLVRARLSHQWKENEPGPMVLAIHKQREVKTEGGSVLHGIRARVGQIFDADLAEKGVSEGGWRPTLEPEEIPALPEYLQALVHGDLWPANQETVDALNGYDRNQGLPAVKFDPTYGGELDVLKKWLDEVASEKKATAAEKPADKPTGPAPTVAAATTPTSSTKPPTEGKV